MPMLRSVRNPDKIIRRIFGACSSQLSLLSIVASRPASVVVITTIIEFVDFNTSQAEEKAKHHRHSRSMPCTQLYTISFANKPYITCLAWLFSADRSWYNGQAAHHAPAGAIRRI
ncbi:hypothetical protein CC77DRAFT_728848 [Alternaria alternata]|uniref:Uncharacterized protein n=1 Tax=Alternaria alternata TaxID=5599 RepID=A0A177DSK2_ALTAL|nr:hypothetical protein CC77DRAFT_728848 [Alternaria alternata]OAG22408.1 hypothetical protein CC77DRAFT_728848 [Alternaria alternata]